MNSKNISTLRDKLDVLHSLMLVKQDKPHSCYHFLRLLENLREMPAEEFAEAIKGKPEHLNCKTAFELVYNVGTRFKSISSYRESIQKDIANIEKMKDMPLMLLDPIKVISHHKFKYALD